MKLLLIALVAARAKRTAKTCRHHRRLADLADAPAFNATAAPAPGTTGAGFANSPGFAPALGARNALPDDGAKAPPALSPPACASISLVRRVR